MSKISLAPNASGTGTLTISAPNTNTDRTIALPDAAGTVFVSGQALSATTGSFSGTVSGGSTIGVGGATPSASGAGITFPATQSASSDANTLDDYEEGAWTAVVSDGTNHTSGFGCWYTKIGNLVTVDFPMYNVLTTGLSTSAHIRITGLPFVAGQTSDSEFHVSGASPAVLGQLSVGGTSILLYGVGTGGGNILALTLSNGFVSSATISCWGQMSYQV